MPDDPAERRRVAQRAAHVGPLGQRHHAGGQGAGRSPAGAARGVSGVDRVERGPEDRLKVCDPAANSGTLVLPITTTPARRTRSTTSSSRSGTWSAKQRGAVRRAPAGHGVGVLEREREPVQRPDRSAPEARASSAAAAPARARSSSRETIALSSGLRSAMRARCRSSSSRAEISRSATAADHRACRRVDGEVAHRRRRSPARPPGRRRGRARPRPRRRGGSRPAGRGGRDGRREDGADGRLGGPLAAAAGDTGCGDGRGGAAEDGVDVAEELPAILRDTEVSIRCPTPPTMPPTTASAS